MTATTLAALISEARAKHIHRNIDPLRARPLEPGVAMAGVQITTETALCSRSSKVIENPKV
jgi:hypothetical protein